MCTTCPRFFSSKSRLHMSIRIKTGWSWSSGNETGLRRQHVSGSIHLLRETKSQLFWSSNTDMGLCFRVHLNTRRKGLSVGCTSPWRLVWASPWAWDIHRLIKKKKKKLGSRPVDWARLILKIIGFGLSFISPKSWVFRA